MGLEGNYYHEIFSEQAGILNVIHKQTIDVQDSVPDYLESNNQDLGLVIMENEIVSESSAAMPGSALYKAST